MATPTIPPRPARAENAVPTIVSSANIDIPQVPRRPNRSVERSVSPNRDSYARSPLNDPAFLPTKGGLAPSSLSRSVPKDLPPRPPSVSFPSVGEEGSEYLVLSQGPDNDKAGEQTKTAVAGDLPLHAPKASLPVSTAKSRIAAVTRTDSASAAAVGIGKASSEHGSELSQLARTVSRASSSHSRPSSIFKGDSNEIDEQGIPEIGMQIPLYPNAGDVQAPTPQAVSLPPPTGVGFFNKGDQPPRHHFRTKSGREFTGPPGSYGLHGHGINQKDPFEKAWYDKHPEEHKREAGGEYGPHITEPKKPYNLTSIELNKLVHEPHADTHDPQATGTPDEQIGYLASDEYASRMSSTRPTSAAKRRSQTYAESPLRKTSFPAEEAAKFIDRDDAGESDEEVIHIDHPSVAPPSKSATPSILEHGTTPDFEGAPILASDEAAFRPEAQYLTPAVEPGQERRGSGFFGESLSRPHSRSNSVQHQAPPRLTSGSERDLTSTPLEDVKEYEPLFPEDEGKPKKKAPSIRREDTEDENQPRHYFPSKDVWEDVPDSMLYETTVKTPQVPEFSRREAEHEPKEIFDGSEADAQQKAKLRSTEEPPRPDFLKTRGHKSGFNKDIMSEMPTRPGLQQRFPSQDIWEDTPDSLMYTTTVTPEPRVDALAANPPQVPLRPGTTSTDESGAADRKGPIIPERPKPSIPSRPARTASRDSPDGDESSATAVKSKPPVPSRPVGSKISALKAGFLNDLNSKLGLGPQAPKTQEKETEPEEEKAPLADARKGRARGPARRKPGASPSGSGEDKPLKLSFATAVTIWEIDEEGELSFSGEKSLQEPAVEAAPERPKPKMTDSSSQTGQLDIEIPTAPGEGGESKLEKVTLYIGGRADKPGSVVVKDGKEHVGENDGLGGIERTSPVKIDP